MPRNRAILGLVLLGLGLIALGLSWLTSGLLSAVVALVMVGSLASGVLLFGTATEPRTTAGG